MEIDPYQLPTAVDHEIEGQEHLAHAPLNVRRAIGALSLNTVSQEKEWSTGERTKSLEIRPYQVDAWVALQEHRDTGAKNALLHMATGLGKTTVAAGDIAAFIENRRSKGQDSPRILFLAHQVELVRQASDRFCLLLPEMTVSKLTSTSDDRNQHAADIVCATLQSMRNRLSEYHQNDFDYVIVDESHHAMANHYNATISHFEPEFRLGVTATPFRSDEKDLSELFGETVYSKDLGSAIAEEWLVKPDYRLQIDDVLEEIVDQEFKSMKELNEVLFSETRNEEVAHIVDEAVQEVDRPKVIIFCRDIAHAEATQRFHSESKTLHSGVSTEEREKIIDDFKNGELSKIITVDVFNEGVDVPEANILVFLRSTASRTIFEQQLGRGLRPAPHKDKVIVLDFVGTAERLQDLYALGQDILRKRRSVNDDDRGDIIAAKPIDDAEEFVRKLGFEFTEHQIDLLKYIQKVQERFEEAPDGWYSFEMTFTKLGCSQHILSKLVDSLSIVPRKMRSTDNGRVVHFISPEDFELIEQTFNDVEQAPDSWLSVHDVGTLLGRKPATIEEEAEKAGFDSIYKRTPYNRTVRYFPPEQIEKIERMLENSVAPEGWLTLTQTIHYLERGANTVKKAAQSLGIDSRWMRSSRGKISRYFSPEQIASLEAVLKGPGKAPVDWVSHTGLEIELGVSSATLDHMCKELGITSSLMRSPRGQGAQYFSPEQQSDLRKLAGDSNQ